MYLGIDFSGGAPPWRARCARPTVWIARIHDTLAPRLTHLRPVQDLPGQGEPFARLASLLRAGDHAAAAIDAPFSIPAEHLPPGGHAELLARIAMLPPEPNRPFPSGRSLVALATEIVSLSGKKPYRAAERIWTDRGVSTRSTLWNGSRGGAPFTAACLTLLARSGRPIWPWSFGTGMLVEAFPAAQLHVWGLPHKGYGKPGQRDVRARILAGLAEHLSITPAHQSLMLETPDALDAAVAGFAAMAAERSGAPAEHPGDGRIGIWDR